MSNIVQSDLISRRALLRAGAASIAAGALAGCTTMGGGPMPIIDAGPSDPPLPSMDEMYGPMEDGGFSLPAIPYQQIDPQFLRQIVRDPTGAASGSLVVNTTSHHLFLVRPNGWAIRYGVGLGRAGFEWAGDGVIQWKQAWPKWTPPDEMIARDPKLAKFSKENGGQPPGLRNPLGARAMYIFRDGQDTLYRVHGSPEWKSIGKSVSSGCVRMMNQDVIDLYSRVGTKAPIIVTDSDSGREVIGRVSGPGMAIDDGIPEGSVLLGRVE